MASPIPKRIRNLRSDKGFLVDWLQQKHPRSGTRWQAPQSPAECSPWSTGNVYQTWFPQMEKLVSGLGEQGSLTQYYSHSLCPSRYAEPARHHWARNLFAHGIRSFWHLVGARTACTGCHGNTSTIHSSTARIGEACMFTDPAACIMSVEKVENTQKMLKQAKP